MHRRDFIEKSIILAGGVILPSFELQINPVIGFFVELMKAVALDEVKEEIETWVKRFQDKDFCGQIHLRNNHFREQGFTPYRRVYVANNFFVYPVVKKNNRDKQELRVPFYYTPGYRSHVIDMNESELRHLSAIAARLIKDKILEGESLRESILPIKIVERQSIGVGFKRIVYESINGSEVLYECNSSNEGFFMIDGVVKKEITYNIL